MSRSNLSATRKLFSKGNYATSYSEITTENPQYAWRDGMVSGNGEIGYVTSGAPYSDTYIFQNIWFIFPSNHPRNIPNELSTQLAEARENVYRLNEGWKIKDANGNTRKRTFYYSYHPGHQLRLNIKDHGNATQYMRWTNYETAETGVRFIDERGEWLRTSFTSRTDNVTITKIVHSSHKAKLNMVISINDISSMQGAYNGASEVMALRYKKLVDPDCHYIAQVAHYPSYEESELSEGGYGGVTRIIVVNGMKKRVLLEDNHESINVGLEKNPAIEIRDADALYLITKSDRTFCMGELSDFPAMDSYDIINQLNTSIDEVVERYQNNGSFDYEAALEAHVIKHAPQFNAVRFELKDETRLHSGEPIENSALIQMQQNANNTIFPAFIQQVYDQGRYAMICCSGSSAPRLYGMWTGEWNAGWRSIYTLDANVNLQVAAMNTGRIEDAAYGYITFFLRNTPDFAENATMAYGMHDALQVSVNSDGDRGMHVEYDNDYPFQYWNAGASWCLLPIYEYWQCYGNQQIPINAKMRIDRLQPILGVQDGGLTNEEFYSILEKGYLDLETEILLPLLTKQANFWEQICTPEYYTDVQGNACYQQGKTQLEAGEKYIIIPGYSPENHPIGYHSTITANATMDIAAARDGLYMVIALEKTIKRAGYLEAVAKWEALLNKLPNYLYDSDGALCEWAMKEYKENNNHRHLSHLYPAWPAYETQTDAVLEQAARIALKNRNTFNIADDTAGHGWMHKALVAARLKDGDGMLHALLPMMINHGYYTSLMTDHDTNRRCDSYCTDSLFGTVAAINEAFVYSNTGEIELLPALPSQWNSGSIHGLMTRTQVEIRNLSWDLNKGEITASLYAFTDQSELQLRLGVTWSKAEVINQSSKQCLAYDHGKPINLTLNAGTMTTVIFKLS